MVMKAFGNYSYSEVRNTIILRPRRQDGWTARWLDEPLDRTGPRAKRRGSGRTGIPTLKSGKTHRSRKSSLLLNVRKAISQSFKKEDKLATTALEHCTTAQGRKRRAKGTFLLSLSTSPAQCREQGTENTSKA